MLGYPAPVTGVARDLFDRMADGKDRLVRQFASALPKDLLEAINCAWADLPPGLRRRFGRPDPRSGTLGFEDALAGYSLRQQGEGRAAAEKQRALYRAFERAHLIPGSKMREAPNLADLRDFRLVFDRDNNACCTPGHEPPAPKARRVGIRLTNLQCLDETGDWRDDDISLLCVVVDGNAKVTTTQTAEFSMGEGDNRTLSTIIYGPTDASGFLDIAISMVEHDSSTPAAGQTISAVGEALTKAGVTKSAGIALEIIGAVVSLLSALNEDDFMGTRTVNWTGDIPAKAAGSHLFSYSKSGDYHYRVGFQGFAID